MRSFKNTGLHLFSMDDIFKVLFADILLDRPGREDMASFEHGLHFFNRAALGLGEHEHNVEESNKVKGGEEEISAVRYRGQSWGNGPCKCGVEGPVGCCGEGDSFAADARGENFGRTYQKQC